MQFCKDTYEHGHIDISYGIYGTGDNGHLGIRRQVGVISKSVVIFEIATLRSQ